VFWEGTPAPVKGRRIYCCSEYLNTNSGQEELETIHNWFLSKDLNFQNSRILGVPQGSQKQPQRT
jgi:hypothetical protein